LLDRKSFFLTCCIAVGVSVLFLDTGAPDLFGDSIAVLWGRPHTWHSLLRDFVRLDEGRWFRPFSNSLPPYLLWPLFGANFLPYHLVALALHTGLSIALFAIFLSVFRNRYAAFVGAAFFAFHPVQFYATYDIAFYQETITAALALSAVILFIRYVNSGSRLFMAAALSCLVVSLCSKETAVMVPGGLAVALGARLWKERRAWMSLAAASALSVTFTFIYARIFGVVFRYQEQYRPRWGAEVFRNFWESIQWAFGLPAGWQTAAWHSPPHIEFILWAVFVSLCALAIMYPRNGLWRGPAWFVVTALPVFLTRHLLPHHIHFALIGIAYLIGAAFLFVRQRFRMAAPPAAAVALSALFIAAFLGARKDAVMSWVGQSALQVNAVSQFLRASGLQLRGARGVVVRTGKAPNLSFDWMSGDVFKVLSDENLEVRISEEWPAHTPDGFYHLEYRNKWLWNRTPDAVVTSAPPAPAPSKAEARLYPPRLRPGEDSYCLEIPILAGHLIDLKYRYNERFPRVAYEFTRLNQAGQSCLSIPANVPWGTIDVIGARRSGTSEWASVEAQVELLP